jgi:uncharacterized protein YndB with AHSA1/START domain
MEEYGVVTERGTVRMERMLPGPIERVWAYLTESEKRRLWLASGEMELRVGGKVELHFLHSELSAEKELPEKYKGMEKGHHSVGRVTRCEPPRLIGFTWDEGENAASEVVFELTPRDRDVLMVLTHTRLPTRASVVGVSGGWHAHLGVLIDRLNGREPRGFWSYHTQVAAEYEQRIPPDDK